MSVHGAGMTRRTLFRYLLAMKLLVAGSVTCYWFALPKEAKFWNPANWSKFWTRTILWEQSEIVRKLMQRDAMRKWIDAPWAPISDCDFRIPFEVIR